LQIARENKKRHFFKCYAAFVPDFLPLGLLLLEPLELLLLLGSLLSPLIDVLSEPAATMFYLRSMLYKFLMH
jgi:hypothetical protein